MEDRLPLELSKLYEQFGYQKYCMSKLAFLLGIKRIFFIGIGGISMSGLPVLTTAGNMAANM